MDNIFGMGTTVRHGRLLGLLENSILNLFFEKKIEHFSESVKLVYYGNKKRAPGNCELVCVDNIICVDNIKGELEFKDIMNDLGDVEPDYMHFSKGNDFILNKKETRVAGYPNLIVEVWSENNSTLDREFKKYLYSTSAITEHWYIEQDSNVVECWYGDSRIDDKNLADILKTRDGIEFDLRYLKL